MDGFDLRVLLLTSDFAPVQGGIGNYATEIARRISNDVELHVVAPNPKVSNYAESRDDESDSFPGHVTIHRLGSGKTGFLSDLDFQIKCRSFVKSFAKKQKIDLIHSQSTMPDLFIHGDAISTPVITTIHTTVTGHIAALRQSGIPFNQMSGSEKSTMMISPFFKALERSYYSGSRRYITVSEWGKKTVSKEKGIDPSKIEVIYIGVDPERYSPSNRSDACKHFEGIPETSTPKVLYFSRFATRKGVHLLAECDTKNPREGRCALHIRRIRRNAEDKYAKGKRHDSGICSIRTDPRTVRYVRHIHTPIALRELPKLHS